MDAALSAALAWASSSGLMVAAASGSVDFVHAPFALGPTEIPSELFLRAVQLAKPYNLLYDRVSRDAEWLLHALEIAGNADAFTGRLMSLFRTVLSEGISQPLYLGIHRSDYMMHVTKDGWKDACILQVEFNTISASFGVLSSRVAAMHRYLVGAFGLSALGSNSTATGQLPENTAARDIPGALAAAHAAIGDSSAWILFVVQPGERNVIDQRAIEFELWNGHGIRVVRLTLQQINERCYLNERRALCIRDEAGLDRVASVVYYRAGYTPVDYPSEAEWEARLLVERSMAVKCPPICYHLAGTKKVQQELARPGAVERFLDDADAALVRQSFAGLWGLDDAESQLEDIKARAIAHPESYVLKPQREGGGNNFYGEALRNALETMPPNVLAGHVLMERILPPEREAVMVRLGKPTAAHALNEIGIYGVFLGDGSRVLLNASAGHLVRTKIAGTDEGGVAAGYAVLDSPLLI